MGTEQIAAAGPVERGVGRLDPERAAFEKWLQDVHLLDGTWNEARNCYDEFPCHLAFQAWRAARPKRADLGRLVKDERDGQESDQKFNCLHPSASLIQSNYRCRRRSG